MIFAPHREASTTNQKFKRSDNARPALKPTRLTGPYAKQHPLQRTPIAHPRQQLRIRSTA
jgi:hypothetical protein